MIEEEAAKKRRLRAKIEAGFTQLNDLEQMITDLEGELDEEADGSETADQIEDVCGCISCQLAIMCCCR